MPYREEERHAAFRDENDLRELNRLLDQAGTIADTLTLRGYEIKMTLWHETRGSHTVVGRLQGNVAKARMNVKEAS